MAAVSVSRDVGLALVVVSALVATACGAAEPEPAVETVTVTSMADPSPVVGPSTPATQASLAWADVMDRVRPAVVRVSAGTCGEATSLASGFFIDDRHIVTAAHVVDGSSKVSVQVGNSDFITAETLDSDPANDVALLRTQPGSGPGGLPLAEDEPAQASEVAVVGYPLGAGTPQIVDGLVSGTSEPVDYGDQVVESVFTTNASTNPGNSGGPVLDQRGQVIGLVSGGRQWDTMDEDRSPVEGINYVVPATAFAPLVREWAYTPSRPIPTCSGDESAKPDEERPDETDEPTPIGFPIEVLSEHPLARELALVLHTHGSAINGAQYGLAWSYFTVAQQERLDGLLDWTDAVSTAYWEELVITDVEGDTSMATVSAVLRTEDYLGGGDYACTVFRLDYEFSHETGAWLIDRARSTADPEDCVPTRG